MTRVSLLTIAAFFSWLLTAALTTQALAQRHAGPLPSFEDAEKWALVFDDPTRDTWQKPERVIRTLALPPNAAVADIGAGTGYFAVRLARAIPKGRVFGVDVEPNMVRYLAERARHEALANLTALAGEPDDPRLPMAVDLAIMVDVYHHIGDRVRYFRNLRRYLKPGGRVAIIDHRRAPEDPPEAMLIAPSRVKEELKRAGFGVAAEHGFLPNQFFLIFKRRSE